MIKDDHGRCVGVGCFLRSKGSRKKNLFKERKVSRMNLSDKLNLADLTEFNGFNGYKFNGYITFFFFIENLYNSI